MLFARRVPPTRLETLRVLLWPRRSWRRSTRYAVLRLGRLAAQPEQLALGVASGVFVAVLPLPGLQMLSAALLAWLVRGHTVAALLATFAANPLTMPVFWILSYVSGTAIQGAWGRAMPAYFIVLVGALPLAAAAGTAAYFGALHLLGARAQPTRMTIAWPREATPLDRGTPAWLS